LKNKNEVINAMLKEIKIKSKTLNEIVQTIYFGGGTPSLLETDEINCLINMVCENFKISSDLEITLEANPDDLTISKLKKLSKSKINRLSIGVQSFLDHDLKIMNRAHNSKVSKTCIENAKKYFKNISIDLIYGMPDSNIESWEYNLDLAISFNISHVSAYALTIEPKTALERYVRKGSIKLLDEEIIFKQYELMFKKLTEKKYINYEFCSFGKEGYFSKNNTAYWLRKKYLGIGPSAHSFNGISRSWNISNNNLYVKAVMNNEMYYESEKLSVSDQYNEYIMTGLRTMWGVSTDYLNDNFGLNYKNHFIEKSEKFIDSKHLKMENNIIKTTNEGKFLSDGIASDLFIVKL
tara:strand:+ start:6474 stop:7526 length:1053 start_codon:yes stop_codon:yes gene_type:complete